MTAYITPMSEVEVMNTKPSTMSLFDKDEVAQIIAGHGDWFGAVLIRLIAKADNDNRQRLYTVFPEQVDAVHRYQTGHDWSELPKED